MTQWLLLLKGASSLKMEASIAGGVVLFLVMLPVMSLAALTDLGALSQPDNKLYDGPASKTNTYIFGYCTFWAAQRREEIGKPIPNDWGDAHTWDDNARKAGYVVDHTPGVGAIMQTDAGKLGHVAFVEKVEPDGSWTISEMNAKGWDILSGRVLSPKQAEDYNFIH